MFTYTVIGSGALGAYYGGLLAKSGRTVRFLARSDYRTIQSEGLRVESINGDFHLKDVQVYDSTSDIPPSDVVLITLKTTANNALEQMLRPVVSENTILCVMQNGLGMEDELAAAFPSSTVIGAMCFICSHKIAPGVVRHLDFGHVTLAPRESGAMQSATELQREFLEASIKTALAESLGVARWKKLLWNIPYNGLSVVLNADTRRIMQMSESRALVRDIMVEVVTAANCCGYALGEESIDTMLEYTDSMTPYAPSMKLDYDNGRPMEIEYIYRKAIAAAKEAGCAMPKTEMLANLLSFRDEDRLRTGT